MAADYKAMESDAGSTAGVDNDDDIVQMFLAESREGLDALDRVLVALETQPDDVGLLAGVYRTVHTIKGTCGFLGYGHLEALSHVGENLLDALRSGELVLDSAVITSLLSLFDAIRRALDVIETTGEENEEDYRQLLEALAAHVARAGKDVQEAGAANDRNPKSQPSPHGPSSIVESSVRVDVAVLDKLMDLIGELVLTRNRIGALADDDREGPLSAPYRQLRLVTGELQGSVMEARLQPVGSVTGKFPRIARDLAVSLGKQVHLELGGEDVGVDRAINDALRDPLMHLVRNAIDHGIESPADRVAMGKAPEGRLAIRAAHEGGLIRIEVVDDGRGIDRERLVGSARHAGLLSPDDAGTLSEAEALELMFLPGLSTKATVTKVSGRGVGLDVVRSNLDEIGGTIEVTSEVGKGTRFCLNVPLTLAVMPTLVVWCGGRRYEIPQVYVLQVVDLGQDEVSASISFIGGAKFYWLGDRLVPLVELAQQLGVTPLDDERVRVAILGVGGKDFGVVVDGFGETAEVLVKPLTRAIRAIPLFSGVTILSDGSPSLILDAEGLASVAGVVTPSRGGQEAVKVAGPVETSVLLAATAGGGQIAVALTQIQRLEQFLPDRVQRSGTSEVVNYGDQILPLLRLGDLLPADATRPKPPGGEINAIVCTSSAGLVGLVVERIDDVVVEPPTLSQPINRRGVSARLMINDRLTELVDIEALVIDAGLQRSA